MERGRKGEGRVLPPPVPATARSVLTRTTAGPLSERLQRLVSPRRATAARALRPTVRVRLGWLDQRACSVGSVPAVF